MVLQEDQVVVLFKGGKVKCILLVLVCVVVVVVVYEGWYWYSFGWFYEEIDDVYL